MNALNEEANYFYLHGMFITFPKSFLMKLKAKAKIVYDAHEYDLEPIFIRNSLLRNFLSGFLFLRQRSIGNQINSCFTVSSSISKFMQKNGFKNIQLKPNVSDLDINLPTALSSRKKVLMIAGQVTEERGIKLFLRFFAVMCKHDSEIALHLHCNIRDDNFKKI